MEILVGLNPFLIRASFERIIAKPIWPQRLSLNPFLIRASFERVAKAVIEC